MTRPTYPVLDTLRSIARVAYEFAATADRDGDSVSATVHERTADIISAANPACWTEHPDALPAAVLADQTAAHLYLVLRDEPDLDPIVYTSVQQVHSLMQTIRSNA